MKKRTMTALGFGVAVALSAASAHADPGKSNASAQAMQIRIDKKTGRKIGPDDSAQGAAQTAESAVDDSAMSVMPTEARELPTAGAHGTRSARLGLRQMKYLTVTLDEHGNRHVEHKTLEELESGASEARSDRGEK